MTISGSLPISPAALQPIAAKGATGTAPVKPAVQPVAGKVDADGDHDGTVGTKIDVKA